MDKENRHKGMTKGFTRTSKAWYSDAVNYVSINIGMYDLEDGGTTGEFHVKWHDLGGMKSAARVEIFEDVFSLFKEMPTLFKWLSEIDGQNPSEEFIYNGLLKLGFTDMTEYKHPEAPSKKVTIEIDERKAKALGLIDTDK